MGKIKGTEILLVAAAGCAAMVLPVALDPSPNVFKVYDGPFFPIMQKTVEEMQGFRSHWLRWLAWRLEVY